METICICSPTSNSHFGIGIFRSKRNLAPADYLFKIQSYSLLKNKKYESGVFEAGGYKWKLVLHPGDYSRSDGYVSLFLEIVETEKLANNWNVNVNFKLFVADQKHGYYLTIQDAGDAVRTFSKNNIKWGFEQLISLSDLKNSTNGYLDKDKDLCVFGAEIFVIRQSDQSESLYMVQNPTKDSFNWTLENFSTLKGVSGYHSEIIAVGDRDWRLRIYPKGSDNESRDKYLSLYLELKNCGANKTLFANYKLKILDQLHNKYHEVSGSGWFRPPGVANDLIEASGAAKDWLSYKFKSTINRFVGASVVESNLVKASVKTLYGATAIADKYIGASAAVNNWIGSDNIKGFPKFISLSELNKKTNGYVKNNVIIMEVDIHVTRIRTSY